MNKIVLIEPQSKEDHVYKHVHMPRLGLPILGTQLQEAGYQVSFFLGTADSLPWSELNEADLVGISTTTATCSEAYQIAGMLRSSGVTVVIGGIHATFMAGEALQFADYVVRGEGEDVFLSLVRAIEAEKPPAGIAGVSYWSDGRPVHNPDHEKRVNMDSLPIPDLTLLKRCNAMLSTPVMTSRGCPYSCTFCCVTEMFGKRYRRRCIESVLQELNRYQGKNIFFCDDNFTADPGRTKDLLRKIIDRGIRLKSWGAQVRVDAARDRELIELMKLSGCRIVYIGFESINPSALADYNKQQTVEDIENAIRCFHDFGIRVHGMFVFGADSDTVNTIRQTAEFALHSRIDSVQFLTLTPFPGTPFFDKLKNEGRILTDDWSLYDGHHAVFQPALMSPDELQSETIRALKRFYSLKNILRNLILTGWGSVIHRTIGWGLTRHFEWRNRWYDRVLQYNINNSDRPVTLFYRCLKRKKSESLQPEGTLVDLKYTLSEQKGILYLKVRGLAGSIDIKELKKALREVLPRHYSQLVVNIAGLRFTSEKVAEGFGSYLEKLGCRVRRLQVVLAAEKQAHILFGRKRKNRFRFPRFELLMQRQ